MVFSKLKQHNVETAISQYTVQHKMCYAYKHGKGKTRGEYTLKNNICIIIFKQAEVYDDILLTE